MKSLTLVIGTVLLCISCKKILDHAVDRNSPVVKDGYTEYAIDSGAHYTAANSYKAINNRKVMHFIAWFDSTCIYTSSILNNQGDINKLYGFADCNLEHQQSSARVGWNWNGQTFNIYAYCYSNGLRQYKLLGSIAPLQKADLSISIGGNKYAFSMNGKTEVMERGCSTESIEGYQLYPYFGGDEVAPHRMKIYIKEL